MSESIRDAEAAVRELGALPVPTGSEFLTPELRATIAAQLADARPATAGLVASMAKAVRDVREHEHPQWEDLYCLNLVSFMGERMGPVLRRLLDAEARVAELEAAAYGDAKVRLLTPVEQIRHLHAAVAAQLARAGTLDRLLREAQARVAELEAALPSRFTAPPAEVDAYLRTVLAEETYLRFQQEIGAQALGEVVEDAQKVRASADNDGLYNADWREGWDDAIERVDPDLCGPAPSTLVAFADEPQADGITRRIAPVQALREDEPAAKCRCDEPGADPYECEADDCNGEFSELNPFGGGPVHGHDAKVSRVCGTCGWRTSVWHVDDGSAEEELHGHVTRVHGSAAPAAEAGDA